MMAGITPNTSNQQLVSTASGGSDNDSATTLLDQRDPQTSGSNSRWKKNLTVAILCFINLINYMDRFTLAGVLEDVKKEFSIADDKAGLLQTVFVASYMVFAPLFGYLGDRYSRRWIMASGISLWCMTTFIGSYLTNFHAFMLFRGLVGIGEASYSTIAPTIISDLFIGNSRSKALSLFYFAIPVGSGFGYIVGSTTGNLAGNWRWGLRVTPLLGPIAVLLVMVLMIEPKRGQAESSKIEHTSYWDDIKSLIRNPSFMLSTLAFTCVAFVTGALAWWAPQFIHLGINLIPDSNMSLSEVSIVFGTTCVISGASGVALGAYIAAVGVKKWRRAHPVICGLGLLFSAPALTAALYLAATWPVTTFVLVFIAEICMNLNWAIVADMALYVVVPPRRSTAEAFQILISHLFGDAGSPYLVGLISEALKTKLTPVGEVTSNAIEFTSLQYALYMTCFVEVLGGALFLVTAFFIVKDKEKVDKAIAEAELRSSEPRHIAAANPPEATAA